MQCLYTNIPGTNNVPRKYSVAAILYLLLKVHTPLFHMLIFCTFILVLDG